MNLKAKICMKRNLIWVLLLVTLGACGGTSSTQTERKPVIGVSLLTTGNPFFKLLADAMLAEAQKQGYELVIVSADLDVNKQKNQLADFIVQNVAAVVLTPVDSKAIVTGVKQANEAGIPVFTADIALLAEGAEVVSHVATDNYQAGQVAGQAMIEALNGTGKVAIIDHPEVESVIQRTKGFQAALAASAPSIKVVSILPGGGEKDRSFKAAEDVLQAHSDLAGIFAINDMSALGAVAAIEKANKAGKIKVVGIDGLPEGKKAIKEGKVYADAIQHPDQIGQTTLFTIHKYMMGDPVPKQVLLNTDMYKQADAQKDPSVQ